MGCYLLSHYPSLHTCPNKFGDLSLPPPSHHQRLSLSPDPAAGQLPESPLPAHAPVGALLLLLSSARQTAILRPVHRSSKVSPDLRSPPLHGDLLSPSARATAGGSPRLTPKSKATGRPTCPTCLSAYTSFKRRFSDAFKTVAYIRPKVARPFPRLYASGSYMHRAAHQMEKWTTTEKRICENNKENMYICL
jgi:hypothetical protein